MSALPLRSSVVQRLQRFATYGHLKQLVLRIIADDMAQHPTTQKETLVRLGVCGCGGGCVGGLGQSGRRGVGAAMMPDGLAHPESAGEP